MADTREKILMTALQLFAKDGYEAVSVRTIAEELGMTKGALYRHYKNKRDIFDCIVKRMIQIDAQRARMKGMILSRMIMEILLYKVFKSIPLNNFGSGQKMSSHPAFAKC